MTVFCFVQNHILTKINKLREPSKRESKKKKNFNNKISKKNKYFTFVLKYNH